MLGGEELHTEISVISRAEEIRIGEWWKESTYNHQSCRGMKIKT